MSNDLQFLRRINLGAGSPPAAGAIEGEIAFNAPGAAGVSTTKPVMFFFDGVGWRTVNPDVTVTTQSVTLGSEATIGAAYTAWDPAANKITGNVVIATWGAPSPQAYVLTNSAAPSTDASWTSLGGAITFALAADIITGTDVTKALNSDALRKATLIIPSVGGVASAADVNRIIGLDGTGKIDNRFLNAQPTQMRGVVDVTTAPAPVGGAYVTGDMVFVKAAGTVDAGWAGAATTAVKIGDSLVFDGTNWHILPNDTDLNAYLALLGGTMAADALIQWPASTATVLDLTGGKIDNAVIDCGTY
jgi:hypothetical protein